MRPLLFRLAFSWVLSTLVANATCAGEPFLVVLGVAQDGGFPQAGCAKECCREAWLDADKRRYVSCVAIVDPDTQQRWLLDCTPDFREQLRLLDQVAPRGNGPLLDGIFPTHAHVGHYTGLMHLGREVIGASSVACYAMPRMKYFLESNGPWSQLVELKQIEIRRIAAGTPTRLNQRLTITPFIVPHRDEFSETVGFRVNGPNNSALYLPDIDKWERWEVPVESMIADVDIAFLDGTFFTDDELSGRSMSEIPHPFIAESLQRFGSLPESERLKIRFIHFNHSNPVLRPKEARTELRTKQLDDSGMRAAEQAEIVPL